MSLTISTAVSNVNRKDGQYGIILSVQRYGDGYGGFESDVEGDFVRYSDYVELERQITAYQIAKDNLEYRLYYGTNDDERVEMPPAQVY
jgi:hypothetical protein